ncbi:hypothetical protein Dimus_004741 [Dionaea muscipula]
MVSIGFICERLKAFILHSYVQRGRERTKVSQIHLMRYMELSLNLLLCIILCIIFSTSSSSLPPLCHDNERTALLQFKLSFSLSEAASRGPLAHPKTKTWNSTGEGGNCCQWDGIECDVKSGHVVTLDLRSSFLYGFINPNSTIFNLVHLQILDLSDNNFKYSPIPPALGSLTELKYLNLSYSSFYGVVPIELSRLSKLISLVLYMNIDTTLEASLLKLNEAGLVTLIHNLTSLEILGLSQVQISTRLPTILSNSTRLKILSLGDCGLYGQVPEGIFMLPSLQCLSLTRNGGLVGSLPEFRNSSNLQELHLARTGFSGQIPHSINYLDSLVNLDIRNCSFQGQIPNSLGDLTKLSHIDLSFNKFSGQIPNSFANLTRLSYFNLRNNQLTGDIPSYMGNLSALNLVRLAKNAFTGAVEFDLLFSNLTQLTFLELSDVDVIVGRAGSHSSDIFPQFSILLLASCNLHELPGFLSIQRNLEVLSLRGNKISGPIPGWFCNVSRESLLLLCLRQNLLTGFPEGCSPLPWVNLKALQLKFNKITSSLLPPPSSSLSIYNVANNQLEGEISPLICKATSLNILDLSGNFLSGKIPRCLGNLSNTLVFLNLSGNNLHGTIPKTFPKTTCRLQYLYLSNNQLQGEVPTSLSNCPSLEVLDLASNQINGTFPDSLGDLPQLQGLLLGSNRLNGQIEFQSANVFPKLRILDLSSNSFTGPLPQKIFSLPAIVSAGQKNASYEEIVVFSASLTSFTSHAHLEFSISITYKGKVTSYSKVLNIFAAIDLSNNRFVGTIPESIGNLVGLQSLNLSYNYFTSAIPRSIASLSNIEVMDLSHNMLSGEIPQQLVGLTMLAMFNVSYNNLTGTIPQGNQFNTFENDSFAGNSGLCGFPLSALCGGSGAHHSVSASLSKEEGDEDSWTLVDWIIISLGYVAGLVVGMIFGRILTGKYHEWFVETFGRSRQKKKRRSKAVNRSP